MKRSNEDLTSTWYLGTNHILANISDPLIAYADAVELAILILVCICKSILCGCRHERLWWVCTYKACLSPHFLTLQWVLWYQIKCAGSFDLFFVTRYNLFRLIWNIQRINRMQLYNYDHVPICTKFNIKQNYTVELSLIDRNNSNKKSQWPVEVLSF